MSKFNFLSVLMLGFTMIVGCGEGAAPVTDGGGEAAGHDMEGSHDTEGAEGGSGTGGGSPLGDLGAGAGAMIDGAADKTKDAIGGAVEGVAGEAGKEAADKAVDGGAAKVKEAVGAE